MRENDHISPLAAEQARDRRTDMWAWCAVAAITLGFFVVDILSEMTDAAYAGEPDRWHQLVFFDGSSIVMLVAMFPVLLWLTRRWPLTLQDWKMVLPIYLLATIPLSAFHIAGMVAIRKVFYPVLFVGPYEFNRAGGLWPELLYEYRKDVWTFILYLGVIYAFRQIADLRREVAEAKAEASRTSRITLKTGGTTLFLEAHGIRWARAAGNYVEIGMGDKVHLARITLGGLEAQLQAAGADTVRTHRSWIVNQRHLREVRPTSDGDRIAILDTGEEVPVSRRYRNALVRDVV